MKVIYNDGTVKECPQEEELHVIRHTAAHIMAQTIKRLWPEADFALAPPPKTASTMTWTWATPSSPMRTWKRSKKR